MTLTQPTTADLHEWAQRSINRSNLGTLMRTTLPTDLVGEAGWAGGNGNPPRSVALGRVWCALLDWADAGCPPVLPEVPPADPKGVTLAVHCPPEAEAAVRAEAARTGRCHGEIIRRVVWPDWQPAPPIGTLPRDEQEPR